MTPEERQLLIQTNRLVEENHAMLRKMRRATIWARAWHLLYWLIIVAISVGAYFYIQPYVEKLQSIYGGVKGDVEAVQNVAGQLGELGKFLGR